MSVKRKDNEKSWSYVGAKGQAQWTKLYPEAGGNNQSPVNITTKETTFDVTLASNDLELLYSVSRDTDLVNTGQTIAVVPHCKSSVMGGPLPAGYVYELIDVRFHWGLDDSRGSEHLVNGKHLPMEV